jgi:uncharacterized protein (AIM24 family)
MTAAAWHPDPTGRHELRYWDGNQWTEHVSDGGVVSSSPLQPPAEPAQQEQSFQQEQSSQQDQPAQYEPVTQFGEASPQPASDRPTASPEAEAAPSDQWISAPAEEPAPTDDAALDRTMVAHPHDPLTDPLPEDAGAAPADEPTPDPAVTEESMGEEPIGSAEQVSSEPMSSEPPLAPTMMVPAQGDAAAPPAEQQPAQPPAYDPGPVAQPGYGQAPPAYDPGPSPYAAQPPVGQQPGAAGVPSDAFQGISGDLVDGRFGEVADTPGPSLQNSKLLKVRIAEPFMARNGAMVAYQGNVIFNYQGGGAAKFLKKALTGEGLKLMRVEGQGDVFLANAADNVHILHINNSGLSINGDNVLAFSGSLDWNIERVKGGSIAAGGLFNTTLRGTGWVAITTDGDPVVLNAAEAPTFADTNAIVAWSINLQTSIKSSFTAGALIGRGSGEAFQVAFNGPGFVIVQPSEGATVPPHTH